MIDLNKIQNVYFLGIGGIGMSGLARYFNSKNVKIFGYDLTKTKLTRQLGREGMDIHYIDNKNNIPPSFLNKSNQNLVIYTPAIQLSNSEYNAFKDNGIKMYKRAEILGIISKTFFSIAVAGTHGKTTTASILAHLLRSNKANYSAFIGGIVKGVNTNYSEYQNNTAQENSYCVIEADEYDKSFLQLHPDIAIITNCDPDHLDIYGTEDNMKDTYLQFINQISEEGVLIINENALPLVKHTLNKNKYISYGFGDENDVQIKITDNSTQNTTFTIVWDDISYDDLQINMVGNHNALNTTAAVIALLQLNYNISDLKNELAVFNGIERRMDIHIDNFPYLYIDDYAHHPTEINNLINSVKSIRENEDINIIFQPHLYSRTRDFADDFALSLSMAKKVYLLDIYPAREIPIDGVTSEMIGEKISNETEVVYVSKENLLERIKSDKPEVLLSVGAGDIDTFVDDLKETYNTLLTQKV